MSGSHKGEQPGNPEPKNSSAARRSTEPADPLERDLLTYTNEGAPSDRFGRIVTESWAGGIEQKRAKLPQFRVGRKRFVSVLWLVPIGLAGLVFMIAVAQELRTYGFVQDFVSAYPGTSSDYAPSVDTGFPAWLRWQHFFNLVFMLFIIRAGIQILADHPRLYMNSGSRPGTEWMRLRGPVPPDRIDPLDARRAWTAKDDSVALPGWLGLPGIRHSIGLARWWHFSFDLIWLVNGIVFYILLFATDQWKRLIPTSWEVFPNAASTALQYLSLDFPANKGFTNFNGMQIIAYFVTIFIAAPLAFLTGLLQAPSIAARFGLGAGPLNRQVARTVHFCVLAWMVFFILVHTVMVWTTGLVGNLNHITRGTNAASWWALLLYGLWMLVVVGLWAAATPFTLRYPKIVQHAGRYTVGWVKGLMEWWDPRKTYKEKDISPFFWPNGRLPDSPEYERLLRGQFADYRLRIDGLVDNPVELGLAALKAFPKQEQITQHYCIQGWSGVARWSGVRVADILGVVQPKPEAKWVVFYSFGAGPVGGRYYDCHKIESMRHELTILAYEMNGEQLNLSHGAPLRLRNELELGFKQVKWIEAIEFVSDVRHLGAGQGGYNEDQEFYGYRMPI